MSPKQNDVSKAISDLKSTHLDIEDRGDIADYLGVNFDYQKNGDIIMTQPHLINQIIEDAALKSNCHLPPTPAVSSRMLRREENDLPYKGKFHYRSIVGKLNYLEKSSRPDITFATHSCARFCENPGATHFQAVEHIVKYLKKTREKGIIMKPNKSKSLEVYADADFSGNWYKPTAADDASTAKSRSGYLVLYAGCPIIWSSRLQTQVALSTTEAEYISLSQSLREVIPIINLLKELQEKNIHTISSVPTVFCKAFEDNSGALEIAKTPKMRPRTKHLNLVYHHFREHVRMRIIQLFPISTNFQLADTFTKPLPQKLFENFRKSIMGW